MARLSHGEGATGLTAEYKAWKHMIQRCYDPNCKMRAYYAGRGITVCAEWRKSYVVFLAHVGRRPSPQHSLDRWPDPHGNYEPGNVRWATDTEQARNKCNNLRLEYEGVNRLLVEVVEEMGRFHEYGAIKHRFLRGWRGERLFSPIGKGRDRRGRFSL